MSGVCLSYRNENRMSDEEARKWRHRRGDQYTVIVASVITQGVGVPMKIGLGERV